MADDPRLPRSSSLLPSGSGSQIQSQPGRFSSWDRHPPPPLPTHEDPPEHPHALAEPWRGMEGELKRLDDANIKITTVDLLCVDDSDNVMYEFNLEAEEGLSQSDAATCHMAATPSPTGPGPTEHLRPSPQTRPACSPGSGPIAACHLALAELEALSLPSSSEGGSPLERVDHNFTPENFSLEGHPSMECRKAPRNKVLEHLSAADQEVEGYFSALASLQASPTGNLPAVPWEAAQESPSGAPWVDHEMEYRDMITGEQLQQILSSGALSAEPRTNDSSLSSSCASSRYSSPVRQLASPSSQRHGGPRASLLARAATTAANQRTQESFQKVSPRSPRGGRTSTCPAERETDKGSWSPFSLRSLSDSSSPQGAASSSRPRAHQGSRLSAASSSSDLQSLLAQGVAQSSGEPMLAETAVDLESLTSLDVANLATAGRSKSRMARLHGQMSMGGGSGPLMASEDMASPGSDDEQRLEGGRAAMEPLSLSLEVQPCTGLDVSMEPLTPSRYPKARNRRSHSRNMSWTGGDKFSQAWSASQAAHDLPNNATALEGEVSVRVSNKSSSPPLTSGPRARGRESTAQKGKHLEKASLSTKRAEKSSSKCEPAPGSNFLHKFGIKMGWSRKAAGLERSASPLGKPNTADVQRSGSPLAGPMQGAKAPVQEGVASNKTSKEAACEASKESAGEGTSLEPTQRMAAKSSSRFHDCQGQMPTGAGASGVPMVLASAPSKRTLSRKKRQEMERMGINVSGTSHMEMSISSSAMFAGMV